ncbi:hypothetical protein EMIHUDRAFT_236544 [Emiliania huxleyi CCMP1516]|uniref:HTH La-type RNA-binding domain-containing protein n=2 Tax=Emiliania huxleyi TaxID=2903 RepID=A0A0D3JTA8_EMIH1|nr:hypothetical protein EMIHUDRAFT_236544 [Emiliania huxleyi CCMP1516]EOD26743.1 hypothetical protein EMIHUDRAFT_236544 [Emiliania huxleyi CCMP1516]|eukprot:XP_005779172.1 hypothetical protein EMIHUDRAFT_236544 [Emiliania huxleyi CCMP1516]
MSLPVAGVGGEFCCKILKFFSQLLDVDKPQNAGKSDAPAAVDDDEKRAAAIKKQVEYYFSEANLTNDKFMRTEMAKTSEKWVPISVIMTFNRMKALLPGAEHAPVAAAMAGSEVVEVSEDGEKLRRLPALMKKTVTLGGKEFVGRAAVVAHARPLLQKEGELAEEECSFIKDLLSHHAKAAEKIGAGIASIKAGCNPKFPDTRCFVLVRADGSEATACAGRGQPPDLGEGGDSCVPRDVTTGGLFVPQAGTSYEPGCIVAVKDLAEGSDASSLKEELRSSTRERACP